MDEFAALRRELHQGSYEASYAGSSGGAGDLKAGAIRRLWRALLGDQALTEPGPARVLRARQLAAGCPGEPGELESLLRHRGADPYLERYLEDALGLPQWAGFREAWSRSAPRTPKVMPTDGDLWRRVREAGLGGGVRRPVLVQTMFYGDPARAGRGNSGGVATLLRHLGDALAGSGGLGHVLTVVPLNLASAPVRERGLAETLAPGHTLLRLPVALSSEDALGFLQAHGRIRAALRRVLVELDLRPELIHARFLDDASLASAREAQQQGAALVTTLTPDPHRSLCDHTGALRTLQPAAALEALNKIEIGDELLRRSRGLLGIGRRAVREQLLPYFPQLEDPGGRVVRGIDEGIRLEVQPSGLQVPALLCDPRLELRLAQPAAGRPVILNVGRLSPLKGQLNLLQAWLEGAWWRRYDLVFVGGDFSDPSPTEAQVIGEMRRLAAACPESSGHLAHLEARPNDEIREIEAFFGGRCLAPDPDLYLCSSLKEEFGLSIIEAMAAGMVVCAPIRGGARRYLRHGLNGFLVDTGDAASLGRELAALLDGPPLSPARVRALQHQARETVRREFSIEQVARSFAAFYERVLAAPAREEERRGR